MKIPNTPFSTRLSGSAKETELRLRNIFQWKKKRPPIVLIFLLVVVLLAACGKLVDFSSVESEPPVSDTSLDTPGETTEDPLQSPPLSVENEPEINGDALFDSYVTEFPFYVYTGMKLSDHEGRVFTIEDTPKNLAEAAVIEWYGLNWTGGTKKLELCCGNEALKFGSESDYKRYTIHEVSTLTPEDFTVETMPSLEAFIRWLSQDIQKFGLTEYTVVYADLSWEWTPEQLARGPQLGNGRYERLYLLGKTESSNAWRLYECYWGEHVYNRLLSEKAPISVKDVMTSIQAEDFTNPENFGNVTARQLAAALNAAVDHQISEAEFMDALGGSYAHVFPHWLIEDAWLEGGNEGHSGTDRNLDIRCGLPENIVEVTLDEDNHRDTAYFEDAALYQLVRHKDDYEETIDLQAYGQFKDFLLPEMESALSLMENNPGNFTGYELKRFTPVWRYTEPVTGNSVVLYDFFFGLLTDTPEKVGWAGGMAFDSELRLVGLNVPVQFAVQYRGNEIRAAFMAPEFYYDPADTDLADWAMEHINHALNQAEIYDSGNNVPEEQSKTGLYSTYKDVLLSNSKFSHNGVLENMEEYTADTASVKRTAKYFTILDLDGDRREEVVVWIEYNSTEGFLILREHYGAVFGYSKVQRALMDLKTDGTFSWSGGAYHYGTASLSFSDTEAIDHKITYCDIDSWTNEGKFVVDGVETTNVEFNDAISAQSAKPDVTWHEFTDECISTHFAD